MELAAFDDAGFADDMDRARDRGIRGRVHRRPTRVNLITGLVGLAAIGGRPSPCCSRCCCRCLLLAAVPIGGAAVRLGPAAIPRHASRGSPGAAGCGCWRT